MPYSRKSKRACEIAGSAKASVIRSIVVRFLILDRTERGGNMFESLGRSLRANLAREGYTHSIFDRMIPLTQQRTGDATDMPVAIEQRSADHERVFESYRRWGYLAADLDPLGF